MNMTAFTICPIPEFRFSISIICPSKVIEKAPITAAYIFDLAPPDTGIPPKTIAMMTSIPTEEAVS